MAESIFTVLKERKTETSVPEKGATIAHTIPAHLFPTDLEFDNKELLVEWAENVGIHAILQKGVQKFLIDVRASFKSFKKSEIWTEELGQFNVDSSEWKIATRPNIGGNKTAILNAELEIGIKMATSMKSGGLDDDLILASLTGVYGEDIAQTILDTVNENE